MRASLGFAAAAALLLSAIVPLPAQAGCKRMAFLVNDYGKDGPTKDAKSLLDKHISEWAAQQNIKDYSVGTKSVSCYQFLNFIVFDEHTCTASANVCWGADKKADEPNTANAATGAPPTPIRKTAAAATAADPTKKGHKHKTAAVAAHSDATTLAPAQDGPPAAEADTAAAPAAEAAPAATETVTAPEPAAPSAPSLETGASAPSVETGALGPAGPEAAPAAAPQPAGDRGKASEAASAAAAAAERAAAAAETAANAAKEAAAAAVAASAAGRGSFVSPLGEGKSAHALGDTR
jgi:hypothetical protein